MDLNSRVKPSRWLLALGLLVAGCSSSGGVEQADIPDGAVGELDQIGVVDGVLPDQKDLGSPDDLADGRWVPDGKVDGLNEVGGDGLLSDSGSGDQQQTEIDESDVKPAAYDKPCVEDNSESAVTARDGFIEVCATPDLYPQAMCGDGSGYKFSYRPAQQESKGLLLYFKGGGSCSDYITCWGVDGLGGAGRRVSTLSNAEMTAPGVLPSLGKTLGIFYRVEATNPLRDYDQVYIAYCTGDVGMKNVEQVLVKPAEADPEAPESIKTYFHGQYNIQFALQQAVELFPTPKRIVIFGSSAGAHASMSAVPQVVQLWSDPTTPIGYYSEGGVGVGAAFLNQSTEGTIGSFTGANGSRLVRFAQFSFISDETQRSFAPLEFQQEAAFQAELKKLFEARANQFPLNYRYFAIPGTCHTLAYNPGIFQQFTKESGAWKPVSPAVKPNPDLNVGDVNLVTWLTALVETDGWPQGALNVAGDWLTISGVCPVPGG